MSLVLVASADGAPPVVSENVNMVSGLGWPDGDPFLQRQNEPSIAVSTKGTGHLFAASNDYRTVDLPADPAGRVVADSWLGVYRSVDGGQTWKSRLLPGYPQQTGAGPFADTVGLTPPSPLRAYTVGTTTYSYNAAADPVVRAGTDGLIFVSGMAFDRDTGATALFVARYVDDGSSVEPFHYVDTRITTSGTNLDRPAFAVDVPRNAPPKGTPPLVCGLTSTRAGMAYQAYTAFDTTQSLSQVLVATSADCGATWTVEPQLSSTQQLNQGTSIAIDPKDGTVWVAWRRVANGSQPDAIVLARSINQGQTFTPQQGIIVESGIPVFDIGSNQVAIRMLTLPTLAVSVDPDGNRRLHLAWSQVDSTTGDARVYMTSSSAITDSVVATSDWQSTAGKWPNQLSWSTPAPIDSAGSGNWSDPYDPAFTNPSTDPPAGLPHGRGHQFMPAMTFNQGRLVIVYYDTRFDHTRRYIDRSSFLQLLGPVGQLDSTDLHAGLSAVFGSMADPASYQIDSSGNVVQVVVPWQYRHTAEVRVATARIDAGAARSPANPAFTSARVSKYASGLALIPPTSPTDLFDYQPSASSFGNSPVQILGVDSSGNPVVQQLAQAQANFINLPIFKVGTAPFIGDYIDVAGRPFVEDPSAPYGWSWNTAPVQTPVLHAVWTSNQDVQPPSDGDWRAYTPIQLLEQSGTSIFDGSQLVTCDPGHTGTRNQNVYTARVTEGLYVFSPEPTKSLGSARRSFVIAAQNLSGGPLKLRFCWSDSTGRCMQSVSGFAASFVDDPNRQPVLTVDMDAPVDSTVSQTLFVQGSGSPTMWVTACAISSDHPSCDGTGWFGTVTLNPPGAVPPLTDPVTGESFDPVFLPFNPTTDIQNMGVAQMGVAQMGVAQMGVAQMGVAQMGVAQMGVAQMGVAQMGVAQMGVAQMGVAQASVSDTSISQATYQLGNTGDTAATYVVYLTGGASQPVYIRISSAETVPTAVGCTLFPWTQEVNQYSTAVYTNDGTGVSVVTVLPGQTVLVTLAAGTDTTTFTGMLDSLTLHAVTQSAYGAGTSTGGAVPFQITGPASITGVAGTPFTSGPLTQRGGTGPFTWSVTRVTKTDGSTYGASLSVSTQSEGTSAVTGTIADSGSYYVQVKVTDATGATLSRSIPLRVLVATATAIVPSANPTIVGSSVTFAATVTPTAATGTIGFYDGAATTPFATCTLTAASAGTCAVSTSSLTVGDHVVTVRYGGDSAYGGSSTTVAESIRYGSATSVATSGTPSPPATTVTFTATVSPVDATATVVASGAVQFYDGAAATPFATCTLGAGACSVATSALASGAHTIIARYGGDASFAASSGSTSQFVKYPSSLSLGGSPNPSNPGQVVTFTGKVTGGSGAAATPSGTVTFYDSTSPATSLGSASLGSDGSYVFVIYTLASGSRTITASYGGDGTFAGSSSTTTQSVRYGTSTSVVSDWTPTLPGALVTFTATVSPTDTTITSLPTGTVQLYDGAATSPFASCTLTPDPAGTSCSASTTALGSGSHTITARYGGNSNFAPSMSAVPWTQFVKYSSAVSLSSTPNPSIISQSVSFTVTVTPSAATGSVGLYDGAATAPFATCALIAGKCTKAWSFSATGSHTITARYGGDGTYAGSSGTTTQQVQSNAAVTLASSASPSAFSQAVIFTATVKAVSPATGTPTGSVTFSDGGTVLRTVPLSGGVATLDTGILAAPLTTGAHSIAAVYGGDATFTTATASLTQTVNVPTYTFNGFLSPLVAATYLNAPSYNGTSTFGQGLPMKWQVLKGSTVQADLTLNTVWAVAYGTATCTSQVAPYDPTPVGAACNAAISATSPGCYLLYNPSTNGTAGKSSFKNSSGTYTFTWDTTSVKYKGCYAVIVKLQDGTTRASQFQLQ